MTLTIQAHFDGKVIVPDEPVMLPQNTPLTIRVDAPVTPTLPPLAERQASYDALMARIAARQVPSLPDESTRRESIYED